MWQPGGLSTDHMWSQKALGSQKSTAAPGRHSWGGPPPSSTHWSSSESHSRHEQPVHVLHPQVQPLQWEGPTRVEVSLCAPLQRRWEPLSTNHMWSLQALDTEAQATAGKWLQEHLLLSTVSKTILCLVFQRAVVFKSNFLIFAFVW